MRTPDRTLALALALALCALAAPAAAQYKWVAPNGAITYSDQPPPPGMTGGALGPAGVARPDEGGIPVALRDASSKYPVVLYTAADCTPCQDARTHLSKRGVPYSEKSISTSKDVEAFKRVGFTENSFPAITVGREKLIGFEAEGWNRLLDAAGYPKTSVLPASWRPPAAQPLAAPKPAEGTPGADGAEVMADAKSKAQRPRPRPEADPLAQPAPRRGEPALRF